MKGWQIAACLCYDRCIISYEEILNIIYCMTKSIIFLGLVSVFFLSTPAFAAKSTNVSSRDQAASVECISGAVRNREAELSQAVTTYTQAVVDAYGARQTGLVELYGSSSEVDPKSLKKEVKNIWSAFHASTKDATKDWRKAKIDAWKVFKAEVKACKDVANVADASNASSEL